MTNQEIKDTGLLIRNEQRIGGNTALRVGGVIEGIGYALDNKDAANGYYQATINGGSISVNAPNYVLGTGGNLRLKMPAAGTTASTLTIGNANAVQLWYNGAAVSEQNTWEQGEIISVFYDGTRFMASNSQGGGGMVKDDVNADLDIVDENNNVIVRFKDGEFETQKFDTRDIKLKTADNAIYDFTIEDENGNEIVRFANGHIRTQKFDSSFNGKLDYVRRYAFQYDVECSNPIITTYSAVNINTNNIVSKIYKDNAVLYLPLSYTADDAPTKLVIYCKHGDSVIEPSGDEIFSLTNICHYLLSLGYAVLAADGLPNGWASELGLCERVVGNYVAVQSCKKAYDIAMQYFNLDDKGCFVYGFSQGGHYAQNVVDLSGIPVLACAEMSPVCSFQFHQWDLASSGTIGGVSWTKLARLNVARIFGYDAVANNTELLALEFDAKKQQGYDPWLRNVEDPYTGFVQSGNLWVLPSGTTIDDITMKKHLNAPLKIWAATGDSVLSDDVMQVFIKAARNAGQVAEIQVYSGGSHNLNANQSSIGTYVDDGNTYNLVPVDRETALWFSQFGGINI